MPLAVGFFLRGRQLSSLCERILLNVNKDDAKAWRAIRLQEPLGWAAVLKATARQESQLNLWAWSGEQWLLLSLSLNDHLEGKSTGVTGEERAMWPSCLPARRGNSIALSSQLSQLFWNPLTFLTVREWKHTPFIPELRGGVLSAVPLLSWPDCLLSEKNN